jgi:hypothetical protein
VQICHKGQDQLILLKVAERVVANVKYITGLKLLEASIVLFPDSFQLVFAYVHTFEPLLPFIAGNVLNKRPLLQPLRLSVPLFVLSQYGLYGAVVFYLRLLQSSEPVLVLDEGVHAPLRQIIYDSNIPVHQASHQRGVTETTRRR